jgi:hypothetical protein
MGHRSKGGVAMSKSVIIFGETFASIQAVCDRYEIPANYVWHSLRSKPTNDPGSRIEEIIQYRSELGVQLVPPPPKPKVFRPNAIYQNFPHGSKGIVIAREIMRRHKAGQKIWD